MGGGGGEGEAAENKCELPVGKITNHPGRWGGGGCLIERRGLLEGGEGGYLRGGLMEDLRKL